MNPSSFAGLPGLRQGSLRQHMLAERASLAAGRGLFAARPAMYTELLEHRLCMGFWDCKQPCKETM